MRIDDAPEIKEALRCAGLVDLDIRESGDGSFVVFVPSTVPPHPAMSLLIVQGNRVRVPYHGDAPLDAGVALLRQRIEENLAHAQAMVARLRAVLGYKASE